MLDGQLRVWCAMLDLCWFATHRNTPSVMYDAVDFLSIFHYSSYSKLLYKYKNRDCLCDKRLKFFGFSAFFMPCDQYTCRSYHPSPVRTKITTRVACFQKQNRLSIRWVISSKKNHPDFFYP
jgi:hypothetical protein